MKKQTVAEHYRCTDCGDKLLSQIKVLADLYYCWECYDAQLRRKRLLEAEKAFDECPDETEEPGIETDE